MSVKKRLLYSGIFTILLLSACITAPVFNEAAYSELCELKVLSKSLLDTMLEESVKSKADESDIAVPDGKDGEIRALRMRIAVANEYARNRPDNDMQIKQFKLLMNEDGDLLYSLLAKWESDEYFSPFYVEKTIENIMELFDLMLALESGKEVVE